jgi:hypothetical protein
MSISSPQISTLVKIMESLPVSLQERVTDHLREYINDLQDEIKWDNSFAKSQSKLVAAARIAKQEIVEGKAIVLRQFKDEMQRFLMRQRILRMGYDSQEIFLVCDL